MNFKINSISQCLRGGGACCGSMLGKFCQKDRRNVITKDFDRLLHKAKVSQYVPNLYKTITQLFDLINDQKDFQEINEEVKKIIQILSNQRENLYMQSSIRIPRDDYNYHNEMQLKILHCLAIIFEHSKIQSYALISLSLDLFRKICFIQKKDKFAQTVQYQREQQLFYLNKIKQIQKNCNYWEYEISVLEIAYQNILQQRGEVRIDLLLYFEKKYEINILFQNNQSLLNFDYDSNQSSMKHFELYYFYQTIKWRIIQEVKDQSQQTVDIPIQMYQNVLKYQLQISNCYIPHNWLIVIIFDILTYSEFQFTENDPNVIMKNKVQQLSNKLIESLNFYTDLQQEEIVRPNKIQLQKQKDLSYLEELIQAFIQTFDKILEFIKQLRIIRDSRKGQEYKAQCKKLENLKSHYFKFIEIANEIYLFSRIEIEKIKLIDDIQISQTDELNLDEELCQLRYFEKFQEGNRKLFTMITIIELQLILNRDQMQNIQEDIENIKEFEQIKQIQTQTNKLIQSIKNIKEKQQFIFKSEQYLKNQIESEVRNLQSSQQINNQEQLNDNQENKIIIPFDLGSFINDSSVYDNILSQSMAFNQIGNHKNILSNNRRVNSIDDLEQILHETLIYDMLNKSKIWQNKITTKKVELCKQAIKKKNDQTNVNDNFTCYEQECKNSLLQKNNNEPKKLKKSCHKLQNRREKDKIYINNSPLNQNCKEKITEKISKIDVAKEINQKKEQCCNVIQNININGVEFSNQISIYYEKYQMDNLLQKEIDIKNTTQNRKSQNQCLYKVKQFIINFISKINNSQNTNQKLWCYKEINKQLPYMTQNYDQYTIVDKIQNANLNQQVTSQGLDEICQIMYHHVKKVIDIDDSIESKQISNEGIISKINLTLINIPIISTQYTITNNNINNQIQKKTSKNIEEIWVSGNDLKTRQELENEQPDWKEMQKKLISNHLTQEKEQLLSNFQSYFVYQLKDDNNQIAKPSNLNLLAFQVQNTKRMYQYFDENEKDNQIQSLLLEIKNFYQYLKDKKQEEAQLEEQEQSQSQSKIKKQEDFIYYKSLRKFLKGKINIIFNLDYCQLSFNQIYINQRFKVQKYDLTNKKIQEYFSQGILYQISNSQETGEIGEFLNDEQRQAEVLLLFGQQGSGKTRELQIIINNLREQHHDLIQKKNRTWIPIYISLSQVKDNFQNLLFQKLMQIFKDEKQIYEEFKNSVNAFEQKVLFLLDDIDNVQYDILEQNLIQLNYSCLGFQQKCMGKSVKFIVSARTELKIVPNYKFLFFGNKLDSIVEIELLPFNDEQRKQYFQANHQKIIKKLLYKYYTRFCELNQNAIQNFEFHWKKHETAFLNLIKQQEQTQKSYILNEELIDKQLKTIIQNHLILDCTNDQYKHLVQDLCNLKSSQIYLQMIQDHNIESHTQTPLQLEILFLNLPQLIKQQQMYGFKEQIRKQNVKRIKKQYQSSSQFTDDRSTNVDSSIYNSISQFGFGFGFGLNIFFFLKIQKIKFLPIQQGWGRVDLQLKRWTF